MPMYEFECQKCGAVHEKIVQLSEKLPKKCPDCKGKLQKLISAPAFQFKGSGWYVTDYGKGGSGNQPPKSERSESNSSSSESSGSDSSGSGSSGSGSSDSGSSSGSDSGSQKTSGKSKDSKSKGKKKSKS